MKKLKRYTNLWFLFSKRAFQIIILDKLSFFIFLLGKSIRFVVYILFLYFLVKGTGNLAGYSVNETIFFFLTFNIIDITSQFFFREVYHFRNLIVSGEFDLVLIKPYNPLFKVLLGGADLIDLATIPPLLIASWWVGTQLNPSVLNIMLYLILLINGFLI